MTRVKKKKKIVPNQLHVKIKSENLLAENDEQRSEVADYIVRVADESIKAFNKMYASKKVLDKFELEQLEEDVLKSQHTITCYLKNKPRVKGSIS